WAKASRGRSPFHSGDDCAAERIRICRGGSASAGGRRRSPRDPHRGDRRRGAAGRASEACTRTGESDSAQSGGQKTARAGRGTASRGRGRGRGRSFAGIRGGRTTSGAKAVEAQTR